MVSVKCIGRYQPANCEEGEELDNTANTDRTVIDSGALENYLVDSNIRDKFGMDKNLVLGCPANGTFDLETTPTNAVFASFVRATHVVIYPA